MSKNAKRILDWMPVLLLYLGFWLTGIFGIELHIGPYNRPLGWIIISLVTVTSAVLGERRRALEPPLLSQEQLQAWEAIRSKGKLYYVLIQGIMLPLLVIAIIIVFLQLSHRLGEYGNFNLYTFVCDVAILAALYGLRLRSWDSNEEKYKEWLQSQPPSNKTFDRRPRIVT